MQLFGLHLNKACKNVLPTSLCFRLPFNFFFLFSFYYVNVWVCLVRRKKTRVHSNSDVIGGENRRLYFRSRKFHSKSYSDIPLQAYIALFFFSHSLSFSAAQSAYRDILQIICIREFIFKVGKNKKSRKNFSNFL